MDRLELTELLNLNSRKDTGEFPNLWNDSPPPSLPPCPTRDDIWIRGMRVYVCVCVCAHRHASVHLLIQESSTALKYGCI